MPFIITIHVREGIVMASDSRLTLSTTLNQEGQPATRLIVGQSDSNYRTFLAPNHIGISTYGAVDPHGQPIADVVDSFIREQLVRTPREIDQVPSLLVKYFQKLPTPPDTGFHVAGYKTVGNQRIQQVWQVLVRTGDIKLTNGNNSPGVTMGGEADILARLVQPVWIKDGSDTLQPLPNYAIPWHFFTLQDGIDFAVYALRTTIDSIRFQARPKTVGGPIDVLVIKPDEAFWVQRKLLQIGEPDE